MSHDTKFDKQITDFQRYGTFTYKYDEVGNVIFNSSSNEFAEVYLAFPLPNYEYDTGKILGFYDATFTEFVPATTETVTSPEVEALQTEVESMQTENAELVKQLDELIAQNESSPTAAERQATKQVILELRKTLGEGRVDSDFSEEFPYSPLKKTSNIVTGTEKQSTTATPTTTTTATATTEVTASVAPAPVVPTVVAAAPAATLTTASLASMLSASFNTWTKERDERRHHHGWWFHRDR